MRDNRRVTRDGDVGVFSGRPAAADTYSVAPVHASDDRKSSPDVWPRAE
jgi:hypothetical protein